MKRSIRILRRAQLDLLEIQAYIRMDDAKAAERLVSRILQRLQGLASLSMRGKVPNDARLRQLGFRYLIHGEYLVFYKVFRSQVRVYRVLHGRRRYEEIL